MFRVGPTDVRQIAREDWQRRVAYVSQEPRLLGGTVAENIQYFRDHVSDEAIKAAARMAHIHDEVMAWPGGYDHRVGQRLDAVSGGQRQRLGLARALAGQSEILVLDEPTSVRSHHGVRVRQDRGVRHTRELPARQRLLPCCAGAWRSWHDS